MTKFARQDSFEKGRALGEIEARLNDHDQHFSGINGTIEKLTTAVITTNFGLERLIQQAEGREETMQAIAAALRDAEVQRTEQSAARWNPIIRMVTVISGLAATGTIASLIVLLVR